MNGNAGRRLPVVAGIAAVAAAVVAVTFSLAYPKAFSSAVPVGAAASAPSSPPAGPPANPATPPPAAASPATPPKAATPSQAAAPPKAVAAAGGCSRPVGRTPAVRVTEVKTGSRVTGYGGEGDTAKLPMAIAARPGGSWLAWLGAGGKVHLGKLDCNDRLVGTATSFTGIDLQDVQADANGGVLLLTRKGSCGTGPLCGGASSPCNTMHLVRFDNAGRTVWERQVTNLAGGRAGYSDGARFVWWYQHHGRLASDGTTYAAYFGVAITVRNGKCVDIHQGDRMQVVNGKGALVSGHRDSFEVGCSHSWTGRIVWDPRTKRYVTVCATDNACRIAQPNPYRTVAAGTCDGTLFGGDLVLAKSQGYWTAWSQGGKVRLAHFTTGKADTTVVTAARSSHPHLAGYGPGRMLLAWQSGSATAAQVYDSGTGKPVGARLTIGVRDHDYQAYKSYPDGSVAYPAAGGTATSIRVARVLPSSG